ncbi:MAG: hypothetical protein E6355_00420 [Streptococcus mitis]|jgi:hypothetical protein|nr:hypothetical protein [Streptococcus mitis]
MDEKYKGDSEISSNNTTPFKSINTEEDVTEEPMSVFAEGLPSWDIVPPQLLVRRKRQK